MIQKIKEWFNWTTPSKRFANAFWLGWFSSVSWVGLFQDFKGKEEYLAWAGEHWVTWHWAVWIPILLVLIVLYSRNRVNFEKEMAWMLMKNPNKVTQEEADAIKVLKQSVNGKSFRKPRPPPPPAAGSKPPPPPSPPGPPGRVIKQGQQPAKPTIPPNRNLGP